MVRRFLNQFFEVKICNHACEIDCLASAPLIMIDGCGNYLLMVSSLQLSLPTSSLNWNRRGTVTFRRAEDSFWKLTVAPKVMAFCWKLIRLLNWVLIMEVHCCWICGVDYGSWQHSFFSCLSAFRFWNLIQLNLKIQFQHKREWMLL